MSLPAQEERIVLLSIESGKREHQPRRAYETVDGFKTVFDEGMALELNVTERRLEVRYQSPTINKSGKIIDTGMCIYSLLGWIEGEGPGMEDDEAYPWFGQRRKQLMGEWDRAWLGHASTQLHTATSLCSDAIGIVIKKLGSYDASHEDDASTNPFLDALSQEQVDSIRASMSPSPVVSIVVYGSDNTGIFRRTDSFAAPTL